MEELSHPTAPKNQDDVPLTKESAIMNNPKTFHTSRVPER